jgi:hypothetical protein
VVVIASVVRRFIVFTFDFVKSSICALAARGYAELRVTSAPAKHATINFQIKTAPGNGNRSATRDNPRRWYVTDFLAARKLVQVTAFWCLCIWGSEIKAQWSGENLNLRLAELRDATYLASNRCN